jgi:hypothetical protein
MRKRKDPDQALITRKPITAGEKKRKNPNKKNSCCSVFIMFFLLSLIFSLFASVSFFYFGFLFRLGPQGDRQILCYRKKKRKFEETLGHV